MKGFYLDLQAPRRPLYRLRGGLLLAGVLALGGVAAWWLTDLAPRLQTQRQLLQSESNALSPSPLANPLNARELDQAWQQARAASVQLNLPWPQLFAQLATAARAGQVALLSIEPDAHRGQVALVAEARNLDAMLAFVNALQASPDFAQVALESHTISKTQSEQPVRFHVSASWRTRE